MSSLIVKMETLRFGDLANEGLPWLPGRKFPLLAIMRAELPHNTRAADGRPHGCCVGKTPINQRIVVSDDALQAW